MRKRKRKHTVSPGKLLDDTAHAIESSMGLDEADLNAETSRPHVPGAVPGIESVPELNVPPPADTIGISCIEWSPEKVETTTVGDLNMFLKTPKAGWAAARWINVNGLHPYVVNRFRETFGLHTLAAEDVLMVSQRPKLEAYDNCLFTVVRMLTLTNRHLEVEQVSFFLFKDTLISFQEHPGDVWEPIRTRLQQDGTKVRQGDAGYLLYALVDAVVDHCFPILETYGDLLEELEDQVVANPAPAQLHRLHAIKREMSMLRRVLWPTRDLVDSLYRDEKGYFTPATETFLRDVYDHVTRVIDMLETYREMAGSLTDLYMSGVSNRMNEIMKVLTIMASLFIPVTFLAGVYGMNFDYLPEKSWKYSYPIFWLVTLAVIGGLLAYFRRRKWI